jgi:hypothetical protein
MQEINTVGATNTLMALHACLHVGANRVAINADIDFIVQHSAELVHDLDFLQGSRARAPYLVDRMEGLVRRLPRYSTLNPIDLVPQVFSASSRTSALCRVPGKPG